MRCYICGLKREGKCTMVKKIIIGILAVVGGIFLVFGIIVGFFLVSDFKQEDKLETEIEGFWEMTYKLETLDYEEVYARANRVVTKDDYALVERAMKAYIWDIFENNIKILSLLADENISNVLSSENYAADGPDFPKTKEYIRHMRSEFQECKREHKELAAEDRMMSYVEKYDLDSYYLDFYRERMDIVRSWDSDGEFEGQIDILLDWMDSFETVISFLEENKGKWEIVNDYLTFEDDELTEQYEALLDGIFEDEAPEEEYEESYGEIPLDEEGTGLIQL